MSNLPENFDANLVEPSSAFEPLPAGEYKAIIAASELKPTKAGDGERLSLELQVIEGPFEGRKLFDGLNLKNPSQKAVDISKATLSAICRAVGKMTPRDSSELHNIPLIVKVGIENRKDTGEPQNKIKGYKAVGSPSTPSSSTSTAQAPANGGPKKPAPWAKKT